MVLASETLSVLQSGHVLGFAVAFDFAGAAPWSLFCASSEMLLPSAMLVA